MILVRDEGPVRWLTLNRPDRRNALNGELVAALEEALRDVGDGVRCIAITGAGKAFSAGADLAALQAMRDADRETNLADSRRLAGLFRTIASHELPVIAAVNGPALGGGAGLAVACDVTLAQRDAVLGFVEVRIGFVPAIVLNFLLRAVGEKTARGLCLSGRRIGAGEAERLGLLEATDDLEASVAAAGRAFSAASPAAIAHTKRLILKLAPLDLERGLELAAAENAEARMTADCREGIAAFLEKRKPSWIKE